MNCYVLVLIAKRAGHQTKPHKQWNNEGKGPTRVKAADRETT